ncbi:hypothetical protein C6P40_001149 [Pichia californica]|uniref:Uncharacterized protein n=1 Tax=Pichia californica TaxID=460514 RepID=A0A9P7BG43_9ASCO|nr:hypothetical protein C6P42_004124 [[Candida] californica]KAG0688309.1 hypothetical protein C6P40_001149 [[Candida] californica]
MLQKLQNPNEFINKITKNFNFDPKNGRIVMNSSPSTSPTTSPLSPLFPSSTSSSSSTTTTTATSTTSQQNLEPSQNKMRIHISSNKTKAPKLIPLPSPPISIESKEMKDIAFEVTMDANNQNVHPLDEPFILRNGKKIFPSTASSKLMNISDNNKFNDLKIDDLINLAYNLWKFFHALIITFWNLDLYFNILISEDSTMKIHIPTIIFSLIGLKILYSISSPIKHETIGFLSSNNSVLSKSSSTSTSTSSSSISMILSMIIIFSSLGYWYTNQQNKQSLESEPLDFGNDTISESATLIGSETKDFNPGLIPDLDCNSTNTDTDTLISSSENSKLWGKQKLPYNNVIKLDTIVNKNKQPIEQTFHPVHRQELKQKNQKQKLKLNLPLNSRKIESNNNNNNNNNNNRFQKMTELGREEMLKTFNI